MTLHLELIPILSIAAGIAVIVAPRSMTKYIIGGYLILIGLIQIID